ncbi:MAG TPA: hypothetical protein PLB52_03850 [Candidatus Moranbacteria bacterium]|nr:hypothetical protein [Candidatus Moranbacteria bacterium]
MFKIFESPKGEKSIGPAEKRVLSKKDLESGEFLNEKLEKYKYGNFSLNDNEIAAKIKELMEKEGISEAEAEARINKAQEIVKNKIIESRINN